MSTLIFFGGLFIGVFIGFVIIALFSMVSADNRDEEFCKAREMP